MILVGILIGILLGAGMTYFVMASRLAEQANQIDSLNRQSRDMEQAFSGRLEDATQGQLTGGGDEVRRLQSQRASAIAEIANLKGQLAEAQAEAVLAKEQALRPPGAPVGASPAASIPLGERAEPKAVSEEPNAEATAEVTTADEALTADESLAADESVVTSDSASSPESNQFGAEDDGAGSRAEGFVADPWGDPPQSGAEPAVENSAIPDDASPVPEDEVLPAEAPEADAPEADAPEAEVPEVEALKANAAESEAPEAEVPEPEAHEPEVLSAEAPEPEAPPAKTSTSGSFLDESPDVSNTAGMTAAGMTAAGMAVGMGILSQDADAPVSADDPAITSAQAPSDPPDVDPAVALSAAVESSTIQASAAELSLAEAPSEESALADEPERSEATDAEVTNDESEVLEEIGSDVADEAGTTEFAPEVANEAGATEVAPKENSGQETVLGSEGVEGAQPDPSMVVSARSEEVPEELSEAIALKSQACPERSRTLLKPLTKLAKANDPAVRREAMEALGKLRTTKALPSLRRGLRDADLDVVKAASDAIAPFKGHRPKPAKKKPSRKPGRTKKLKRL